MTKSLSILILEDDHHDAELAISTIEDAGYSCQWERVETREEYLGSLSTNKYDLILADYSLPSFDALSASRIMREKKLEIPFILISGKIGEEKAIEIIKEGANDYVLKQRISRLPHVVSRVLQEAEEHRQRILAEEALRENLAKLSKKVRYETIVSTVTRSVHQSINLQEVLDNAVESMSKYIDIVDIIGIHLVEGDVAILKAHRGHPDWFVKRVKRIPFPRGFTWKTIMDGKPRYCPDVDKDTVIGPAGREVGIKSYVSMPIKYGGKTVGCISVLSSRKNAFDDEEDLGLLEIVAQQISVAINNAEQAEALRKSEDALKENLDRLSKKNRYEKIISTVIRSVHQSIEIQEVLENAAEAMSKNIDIVEHIGIHLVEGDVAVLKAHRGHPDWFVKRVKRIPYPRGFTWKTIMDGKPRYCPDVDKDEFIGPAGREVGTKSYVSMPIKYRGKTVGCINVHSSRKNAFDEEELKLLEIVAQQIEVAINNAKQAELLRQSEEQVKASLKEKEVLLKEIHHRVKNNLQVIYSLLNLQSGYIKDKQDLGVFKESQSCVKSMALIHEKLYQSKSLARIDLAEYIRSLTAYLFRLYGVNSGAVTMKINVEGVSLGIDTAIPCGLIINELVSNSLKYAFPVTKGCRERSESKGEIRIDLHSDNDNKFTLIVGDNGIGLPKDLDFRNTESLGLQLVNTLTKQLEGTIELDRSGRTTFKITFPVMEYKEMG